MNIKKYIEKRIKEINARCDAGIETIADLYIRMELEKILEMAGDGKDVH